MNAPQSHINSRRMTLERAARVAPRVAEVCLIAVVIMAAAVALGAAAAAIPELDAVLAKAEQLRGF
jgi:hypothetical protein